MKKDKDAIAIVAEAWEKMKNEGCSEYRGGKPNLSELSRRTGFGRTVLRRIMSNGRRPASRITMNRHDAWGNLRIAFT